MGMEVVYQDLALAPHLNPVQNMFLGREIPRKGVLGWFGFMDEKAMRAKAESGVRRARRHRPGAAPPRSASMSGGQRQQIAIVRAITWANKIIFLDEPTAALGVVQTKNVLDTIKRVRDKGIAVVLISHSMPHVLEVADRVQVMRLGTRVATMPAEGTTVEQLVGAMTGALDFEGTGREGGCGMSVIHRTGSSTRASIAVVDHHAGESVLKRLAQPAVGVDPRRPAGHRRLLLHRRPATSSCPPATSR